MKPSTLPSGLMTNRLIDPLVVPLVDPLVDPLAPGDCCCAIKGVGAGGGTRGAMSGGLPTGAAATGGGAGIFPGAGAGAVCAAHAVATTTRELAAARARCLRFEPERVSLVSSHRFAMRDIDFECMIFSIEQHEDNCKLCANCSATRP